MKKLILMMVLLPVLAWAGNEKLDPTGDSSPLEWSTFGSGATHAARISDADYGTGITLYDDESDGKIDFYTWENPSITDSTIDSVVYFVEDSSDAPTQTYTVRDSIAGTAARTSSALTFGVAWQTQTVTYTTSPDGGAWTWTDITNLWAGVAAVSIGNKKNVYVGEMYLRVYFTSAAGGGYNDAQVITIMGD